MGADQTTLGVVGQEESKEGKERRKRWGRLPDEIVEELEAAGLKRIPEDWGSLGNTAVRCLKEAGFLGTLELCGMSTLELEEVLRMHDSRAVSICDQIDAALRARIQMLGVQGVPALIWPTRDAWREGKVFTTNRKEKKEMAEQTTAVAEDEKQPLSMGPGELGDEDGEDELVSQLMSEGVKETSARNLAEAFPDAQGLRDIYEIARGRDKERVSAALRSGPADGAVDDLFEERWGDRPLGTSREAGHRRQGERPTARLARLTGFSEKTRIVQVLASIPGIADAQTAEEILAFAQTEQGQMELKGSLRGVSLRRFDDWCEKQGGGRPLGTLKEVTPGPTPGPKAAEGEGVAIAALPTQGVDLATAIEQLTDIVAELARVIENFSIRTLEEAKLLGLCHRLVDKMGFEEAFDQLKRAVELLAQAAETSRR